MAEATTPPALDKLRQRLTEGNLHHALLFHGNDLKELERQARELAGKALLMPEESVEHPDLFHLRPSGKMRIISVDKTRALISELNRSSNQGGAKVALVHEADRMKKAAANAFLKTLEEPPPSTFLFLLTTRPYSILPTILSRCLQVRTSHAETRSNDLDWEDFSKAYTDWIKLMLDRKKLMTDRTTPVFAAYGLAERMIALIKRKSDEECKSQLKELARDLDDKEKDALEVSIRKGVRSPLPPGACGCDPKGRTPSTIGIIDQKRHQTCPHRQEPGKKRGPHGSKPQRRNGLRKFLVVIPEDLVLQVIPCTPRLRTLIQGIT